MAESSNSGNCGSCGRYIGPVGTCSYCGAETGGRLPLRLLHWVAALLGVAGLVVLYATARQRAPDDVRPSQITPAMNFARVWIEGEVTRSAPRVNSAGRTAAFSFTLGGDGGETIVAAAGPVAVALREQGLLPTRGDHVRVLGRLSVTAGEKPRLFLDSYEHIQIRKQ
ncbi:MAG: hypothetical protein WCL16_08010 [bacterium]